MPSVLSSTSMFLRRPPPEKMPCRSSWRTETIRRKMKTMTLIVLRTRYPTYGRGVRCCSPLLFLLVVATGPRKSYKETSYW